MNNRSLAHFPCRCSSILNSSSSLSSWKTSLMLYGEKRGNLFLKEINRSKKLFPAISATVASSFRNFQSKLSPLTKWSEALLRNVSKVIFTKFLCQCLSKLLSARMCYSIFKSLLHLYTFNNLALVPIL